MKRTRSVCDLLPWLAARNHMCHFLFTHQFFDVASTERRQRRQRRMEGVLFSNVGSQETYCCLTFYLLRILCFIVLHTKRIYELFYLFVLSTIWFRRKINWNKYRRNFGVCMHQTKSIFDTFSPSEKATKTERMKESRAGRWNIGGTEGGKEKNNYIFNVNTHERRIVLAFWRPRNRSTSPFYTYFI